MTKANIDIDDMPAASPSIPSIQLKAFITPVIQNIVMNKLKQGGK